MKSVYPVSAGAVSGVFYSMGKEYNDNWVRFKVDCSNIYKLIHYFKLSLEIVLVI